MKKLLLLVFSIFAISIMLGCKKSGVGDSVFGNPLSWNSVSTESVHVEKTSVCINEDVKISVSARGVNGSDANCMVMIGDQPSNPAILRFATPGKKSVLILVKDFTSQKVVKHESVDINVENCQCDNPLIVTAKPSSENSGIIIITAAKPDGPLGNGASYRWNFGDGTTAVTDCPYATHDYRRRKQDRTLSTFVVEVAALDAGNGNYAGRTSVTIPNLNYWSSLLGSPSIPVIYSRFPTVTDGIYTVDVEMNNIYDNIIEFDDAEIEIKPYGSASQPQKMYAYARDILDDPTVPANGTVKRTIRLDSSLIPSASCVVSIRLRGPWEDEKTITASLHLDIAPSNDQLSSGVNSGAFQTVKNQLLIQKLNKAAELIKGRPITPEDVERLEKEGKI